MDTTIEQNTTETQPGYKELDAIWAEALHEFALSRERIKIYDAAIEASQARTRATLDQLSIQLDQIAAQHG